MEQAVVTAAFRKLITEAEVPGFAALEATQIGISEARLEVGGTTHRATANRRAIESRYAPSQEVRALTVLRTVVRSNALANCGQSIKAMRSWTKS